MKKYLLILSTAMIVFLSPAQVISQNYQAVNSGFTRYYMNYNNNAFSDNILPVKTVSAVQLISGDSAFYFYRIIRDTTLQSFGSCEIDTASPCWTGPHSILKANGDNLFFNKEGDTLRFKTRASLGDSWVFLRKAGYYFEASLDSIVYSGVSGINDSIKVISLQAYDNSGNAIANSFNQKSFRLSKNYGFASLYNLYEFPENTDKYASIPFNPLTIADVYNFEPGDIFHYEFGGPGVPENYKIITILSKWSSQDNDTIYYKQKEFSYFNQLYYDSIPHIITTTLLDTTTVHYSNPSALLSNLMPHQKNPHSAFNLGQYSLCSISSKWNGRTTLTFDYSSLYTFNPEVNCFTASFEPTYTNISYTKGCGKSDEIHSDPAENFGWHNTLIYYKQGNEIWGDPTIHTSVAQNAKPESLFEVSPNPFRNNLEIRVELKTPGSISFLIYSITGQQMFKIEENIKQPGIHSYKPDLSDLPGGVYILVYKTGDHIQYKKIIRN